MNALLLIGLVITMDYEQHLDKMIEDNTVDREIDVIRQYTPGLLAK